MLLNIDSL